MAESIQGNQSQSGQTGRDWESSGARLEEIVRILGKDSDVTPENISLIEETNDILYWCLENLRAEKEVQENG